MNKADLITAVAAETGFTKTDTEKFINVFCSSVTKALADGDEVALTGFGTWSVVDKAEREGRNPSTGAPMTIAACKAPKFKPGKGMKDAVNV